jgi:hypothetical protein
MSPPKRKPPAIDKRTKVRKRLHGVLAEGEELLAEGTTIPGKDFLLVTSRRILWERPGGVLSLPFDRVVGAREEIFDSHRYRIRLAHEQIEIPLEKRPLPWDVPAHIRHFRRRHKARRETVLSFSRRDTQAARAIRECLRVDLAVKALDSSHGIWAERDFDTEGVVEGRRRGLGNRLK